MTDERDERDGAIDVSFKIKGMFRINITEGDRIVGDSGWRENVVTKDGMEAIMDGMLNTKAYSLRTPAEHVELGTGTAAYVYTDDDLVGAYGGAETGGVDAASTYSQTTALVTNAADGWNTVQFLADYHSGWNSDAGAPGTNIASVGVYDSDGSGGGVLFAANTFKSSNCATNQAVNVTYNILFGNYGI